MLTVYLYPFSISTGFDTLTILPLSFETSKLLICKLVFAIFDPSSVHVNVKVSSAVTVSDYALHDYFGLEVRLYFLGMDRDSRNLVDKSRDFTGNRYKR